MSWDYLVGLACQKAKDLIAQGISKEEAVVTAAVGIAVNDREADTLADFAYRAL